RMFVVGLLSGSQFKTTRAGHAKLFTRRFSRQVSSLRPFANFRVNCESGAALVVSAFRGGVPGVRVQPSPPGRAVKALLRQRNVQDPILPFFGIRSGPNKHEFFDDGSNGGVLLHQKHARAGTACLKKPAKVQGHSLEITRNENSILLGGDGQHFWVGNPVQASVIRREKVHQIGRNLPKCRGIVWKSRETRIRSCSAAMASTSGSGTPSRPASFAERKSIVGSLREQPLTIATFRSASARKRIIRQTLRVSSCCRARSSFSFRWGGAGCALMNSSSRRSRSAMSFSASPV